ncbi:hypothetical protein P7K49_013407 [Saguinus oedipus]|uniref:Uncharacterized protein n=1 Tax=Saguinus oedipus TaxID=9490 RepID=A0ABQ9VFU5_SAGOE|nr:hypothetical protein P7K49_013407 [Saguinus oedipus]
MPVFVREREDGESFQADRSTWGKHLRDGQRRADTGQVSEAEGALIGLQKHFFIFGNPAEEVPFRETSQTSPFAIGVACSTCQAVLILPCLLPSVKAFITLQHNVPVSPPDGRARLKSLK